MINKQNIYQTPGNNRKIALAGIVLHIEFALR